LCRGQHNYLESLSVLSACASLRSLDVSHNALAVLCDFAAPRALRVLNYSHNNLSGALTAEPLLANRHLEQLDLSVNRLESLEGIGSLGALRKLSVARNQLTSLEDISCPVLTELDASANFIKTLATLPSTHLSGSLRRLCLDSNQISSLAGVEKLALLSALSLRDNALTDMDEVARLAHCAQLVELDLRGTPLAEEGSSSGRDGISYRHQLLHILPGLHVLDGQQVTAQEVVDAHNAHGADATMRQAITHLYLPHGSRTQPHMAPRQVPELAIDGVPANSKAASSAPVVTAANAVNVPTTLLPEDSYWSLLAERKFTSEWTEFLRVAKTRIKLVPAQAEETEEQEAEAPKVNVDLSGISLGEAGCWALAELLAVRRGQVQQLNLNHSLHPMRWSTRLSDAYGLRRLLQAMARLDALQSLSLTHCHLGREGATLLASFLRAPSARASLRALHLQNNLLGQNVTTTLPESGELVIVHACPGLRAVMRALAGHDDTNAAAAASLDEEHMVEPHHQPHALEYLNLTNNLIDPQGARVVADYLAGRGAAESLAHGAAAAVAASAAANGFTFKQQQQEQAYDEFGEPIDSAGIAGSSNVVRPIQLRTLLLDSNPLGDDGVSALSHSLRTNASVTSLSLRGQSAESPSLGVRGFEELAHALSRYNRTIEHIDLGNNANLFAGRDETMAFQEEQQPEAEVDEDEEEAKEEQTDGASSSRSPRSKPIVPVHASIDRRASLALASLLFHATNGSNESGSNLLSLRLDNTGINDGVLADAAPSLAANHSLRRLDLSANPALKEKGIDLLFQALARQGVLASLRLAGTILGSRSALRLADWLRRTEALEGLHVGVLVRQTVTTSASPATDEWGQLTTEAEADLQRGAEGAAMDGDGSGSEPGQQRRNQEDEEEAESLSELAVSTLAGAITVARGRSLSRLALGDLGAHHLGSVVEQLAVPVAAAAAAESSSHDDGDEEADEEEPQQLDENGEAIPRALTVNTSQMLSLDLGGNHWTNDSLSLLSSAVRAHRGLVELRLAHSELDASLVDAEFAFSELVGAVLAGPTLTLLDLSGTPLGIGGLEGIGAALLGPEGSGVPEAALQSLDLSFCGLDEFGAPVRGGDDEDDDHAADQQDTSVPPELAGSKFLQAVSQDACTLTSVSLRGNDFPAAELLRFASALENNWNLRTLNLSDIVVRQGEDSLSVLRQLVAHAVQHGLGSLSLPSVRQPTGGAGAGVQAQRDAIVGAVAAGWRSGVSSASAFLREQQRTPESVLHQLRLDLGSAFRQGAPLAWGQKQKLLEAIRPLNQASTLQKPTEESFRIVQLTAGGVPLRLNTQQHGVCGVDLVENALAARLACQRL
jgi:Leucine-rich repeat (LRR) protein